MSWKKAGSSKLLQPNQEKLHSNVELMLNMLCGEICRREARLFQLDSDRGRLVTRIFQSWSSASWKKTCEKKFAAVESRRISSFTLENSAAEKICPCSTATHSSLRWNANQSASRTLWNRLSSCFRTSKYVKIRNIISDSRSGCSDVERSQILSKS